MTRNTSFELTSARLSRRRFLAATAVATALAPNHSPLTTFTRSSAAKQATPAQPWSDAAVIPAARRREHFRAIPCREGRGRSSHRRRRADIR